MQSHRSTWKAAAAGALIGLVLHWATRTPWLSAAGAAAEGSAAVARTLAVATLMAQTARARPALPPVEGRTRLLRTVGELALVATLASAAPLTLGAVTAVSSVGWDTTALALGECAGLAVLGGCLLELVREPRALVASFLALSWVLPALVGVSVPDDWGGGSSTPSNPAMSAQPHLWPWIASVCAAMLAMALLRPKRHAE